MSAEERTRRLIGVYIHIGEAEAPGAAAFCNVYAVGDRVMLGGVGDADTVAALFSHITRPQLESMVQAVTTGDEKVA